MSLNATDEALVEAAKGGDAKKILRLVEKEGANVNCKNPNDVSEWGSEGGRECAGTAGNTASVCRIQADKHMWFTPRTAMPRFDHPHSFSVGW